VKIINLEINFLEVMLRKGVQVLSLLSIIAILRFIYPIGYQLFISDRVTLNILQPKVIAHRGSSGYTPENTLASFAKALEQKVDIIEFDVHLTKDGEIIVIHDNMLKRITGQPGEVKDYTLAELKKMNAGGWFSEEFKNEKLPTLREVLALISDQTRCIIELKWAAEGYYPELAKKVIAEVNKVDGESWCFVQSYESRYLSEINKLNPNIKLIKAMIGVWPSPFLGFYYDSRFHWGNYNTPISGE
jgi:glycerophosphoryl diester phosphodiesterase